MSLLPFVPSDQAVAAATPDSCLFVSCAAPSGHLDPFTPTPKRTAPASGVRAG